jgi:hypothetical protein
MGAQRIRGVDTMETEHYIEFNCIDCGDHVTRYGQLDLRKDSPDRCMVCWFLYTIKMTEEEKQKIREWGNGKAASNQRKDTVPPDPDALLPHSDLLGKPPPS